MTVEATVATVKLGDLCPCHTGNRVTFVTNNGLGWNCEVKMDDELSFSSYHRQAKATNVCPRAEGDLGALPLYEVIGLAGEAGEAVEKLKKAWRDGGFDLVGFVKELGDVLWYLDACAERVGFTLEEVAEVNINKLKDRQDRGVIFGSGDNR